MSVRLTEPKAQELKINVENLLAKTNISIRALSQVVGSLVASYPGVKYGQLFYRRCDNFKSEMLKEHKGNFSAMIMLPNDCREDLKWWAKYITLASNPVTKANPTICLENDTSGLGCGGCLIF